MPNVQMNSGTKPAVSALTPTENFSPSRTSDDERPRIRRLDPVVVNRIAAGEVIQRPANVLKELLENSLDAGSTHITITIKDGGLKLLQIQDDGCGMNRDDLDIVCERFTTSKLRKYEDLRTISTFGFRGEALASISHVAHLTITTKTKDAQCAWKATYIDGKLVPARPGQSKDPKPCAGNNGTTITVEDLFYNVQTRRRALKSSADEYTRIVDVASKYAIHNSGVAFICRKLASGGANSSGGPGSMSGNLDLSTSNNATVRDNIRLIYGHALSRELLTVSYSERKRGYSFYAEITNPNFNTRKFHFLLFINERLVESIVLKRAIEALYASHLPKNMHPFVYLALQLPPQNVDVNVHPTKKEVHFLHEDEIIMGICKRLNVALETATSSRTFESQTIFLNDLQQPMTTNLTHANNYQLNNSRLPSKLRNMSVVSEDNLQRADAYISMQQTTVKRTDQHHVRTDARTLTLDSYVQRSKTSLSLPGSSTSLKHLTHEEVEIVNDGILGPPAERNCDTNKRIKLDIGPTEHYNFSTHEDLGLIEGINEMTSKKPQYIEVRLTSVVELRQEVVDHGHVGLTDMLRNHTFVGVVDSYLTLVQHSTKLYLVNARELSLELFYQLALRSFSNFGEIQLQEPQSISELLLLALDEEERLLPNGVWDEELTSKNEIVEDVRRLLISRRDMLSEYFSIKISESGELLSLPVVLKNYLPCMDKLPLFLLRLGTEVDWNAEKSCFATFLRELADFYAVEPPLMPEVSETSLCDSAVFGSLGNLAPADVKENAFSRYQYIMEHIVFKSLKTSFIAPKRFVNSGDILELASLHDLYKVFERC